MRPWRSAACQLAQNGFKYVAAKLARTKCTCSPSPIAGVTGSESGRCSARTPRRRSALQGHVVLRHARSRRRPSQDARGHARQGAQAIHWLTVMMPLADQRSLLPATLPAIQQPDSSVPQILAGFADNGQFSFRSFSGGGANVATGRRLGALRRGRPGAGVMNAAQIGANGEDVRELPSVPLVTRTSIIGDLQLPRPRRARDLPGDRSEGSRRSAALGPTRRRPPPRRAT